LKWQAIQKGVPSADFAGHRMRSTSLPPGSLLFFTLGQQKKPLLLFTNLHKVQKSSFTKFIDKGTDLLYISVVRVRFLRCCRLFALWTEAAGSL
jgi:hypothetical protein